MSVACAGLPEWTNCWSSVGLYRFPLFFLVYGFGRLKKPM
jgi:hypothetical protein